MRLANFFKREKKSAPVSVPFESSFYSFLCNAGWQSLSAYQAILYYQQAYPLFNAIDIIAQEMMAIEPMLYNKQKKQFVDQHPLLDLLQKPNCDSTYSEFIYRFVGFYLLTGNNYCIATGEINRPPLELFIVPPQAVTISPGSDGLADNMNVGLFNGGYVFKRLEDKNRFRFVTYGQEIYQTKTFNPMNSTAALYGMSRLNSIYYEIEQYLAASIHNLSMLEKGANPSLVLTSDNALTDEQFQRLQEQMNRFYSGARNSGRAMILENGFTPERLTISNKDMDFATLKKDVTLNIFNTLRIPLPLISPDNMTLANMETAKLNLYDNAVLPLASVIFQELTNFLIPRFKNSENLKLTYDEGQIIALEPRRNEQLKIKKEMGVLTINEIRREMGYEDIEGGDIVYIASNHMPLNSSNDEIIRDDMTKSNIIALLEKQRDTKGNPLFTERDIKKILERAYRYG